ncbi:hypothetical protein EIB18_09185 [Caulobacter vibrioides]|nr:hypothetical protein [Caulobacter vibrioides]AZH12865.1 hypothetical protein EIB18_09185 [Caulobacter vibrioides]
MMKVLNGSCHGDKTDEQRLARRKAKWTPTTLVEVPKD